MPAASRALGARGSQARRCVSIAQSAAYLWVPTSSCLPSGDCLLVADGATIAGRGARKLPMASDGFWQL